MHVLELEWMQWIHQFRGPFFDFFFMCLRFFDRQEFAFVLIPIVWLNYGWKNGLRLFYILFFNTLLNSFLKDIFASPRPCSLNPELGLISIGGYGFPSGAAQTTILLSGIFVYYQKKPWKWAVVIPYVLFVSFSRIYLGVHFPTDILGGWISGFGLLIAVLYFMPRIEKKLKNANIYKLLSLHLFVTLTLIFSSFMYHDASYLGCSIGFATGLWLCHKFKVSLPLAHGAKEYILRALIGVSGVFFICMALPIPTILKTFLSSLWISFLAVLLFRRKFFLRKKH